MQFGQNFIGSLAEIVEQRPPRAARDDANGLTAARQFSVLSTSDVAAILRLRDFDIRRGRPFQTPTGEVPDPFCLCQSVEAVGRPPAAAGRYGQYICVAEYARKQTSPGAQPGGPVRWSRKASLVSKPVDIDVEGKAILTSSLESPDPPLTALFSEEVLHGEFYFAAPDQLTAAKIFRPFERRVNDKPYAKLGADRGCLFIHPFTAEETDTGWVFMTVDIQYAEPKILQGVTYEGWWDVFPDRGRREVIDSSQQDMRKRLGWIQDGRGQFIGDPLPLDGAGRVLGDPAGAGGISGFSSLGGSADWVAAVGNATRLRVAQHYAYVDFGKIPFPG